MTPDCSVFYSPPFFHPLPLSPEARLPQLPLPLPAGGSCPPQGQDPAGQRYTEAASLLSQAQGLILRAHMHGMAHGMEVIGSLDEVAGLVGRAGQLVLTALARGDVDVDVMVQGQGRTASPHDWQAPAPTSPAAPAPAAPVDITGMLLPLLQRAWACRRRPPRASGVPWCSPTCRPWRSASPGMWGLMRGGEGSGVVVMMCCVHMCGGRSILFIIM